MPHLLLLSAAGLRWRDSDKSLLHANLSLPFSSPAQRFHGLFFFFFFFCSIGGYLHEEGAVLISQNNVIYRICEATSEFGLRMLMVPDNLKPTDPTFGSLNLGSQWRQIYL
uniref:Uncharacterized protein n=1 Tax=Musa acuminata subsp. malaccensis TaxID=214687 RepID=A0A804I666_MUSAM